MKQKYTNYNPKSIHDYHISKLVANLMIYQDALKHNKNSKMSDDIGKSIYSLCKSESFNIKYNKYTYGQKQDLISFVVLECLTAIKNLKGDVKFTDTYFDNLIKSAYSKITKSRKINFIF